VEGADSTAQGHPGSGQHAGGSLMPTQLLNISVTPRRDLDQLA
jgi:hypothetical protein